MDYEELKFLKRMFSKNRKYIHIYTRLILFTYILLTTNYYLSTYLQQLSFHPHVSSFVMLKVYIISEDRIKNNKQVSFFYR